MFPKQLVIGFCCKMWRDFKTNITVSKYGAFLMFSVITNIYNKKSKGQTLVELFTDTGKLKKYLTTRVVRCVHHG
jgi:hypothetical protein